MYRRIIFRVLIILRYIYAIFIIDERYLSSKRLSDAHNLKTLKIPETLCMVTALSYITNILKIPETLCMVALPYIYSLLKFK